MKLIYQINKLQDYLNKSGKSQSFIADLFNVSGATVSYWLRGKKHPRGKRLLKIEEFLEEHREVLNGK